MQYGKPLMLMACLFVWAAVAAQQYPFVHYTPKDGLVNSRVRKAYQDSKGRMYFITYGGLSVYDGARFRNYTMQNGLLADLVNDVLEVGDDSLLVAVNTCGLNVLVHGQMKELHTTKNLCPLVNQFLKSADGNIYTTTDDGLYKLNRNSFEKLSVIIPGQKTPAVYLGAIAEYKDFLVFTTNDLMSYHGLFLYNKKKGIITDAFPETFIYSLKTDYTGAVWTSTDKTIAVLDTVALAEGKLESTKPDVPVNTGSLFPGTINFNRQNELLVSSASRGITRYRKDGTSLHIASPELSITGTQNFFIDREDVLWISYDGNGVYKLSNTKLQTISLSFGENKSGIRSVNAAANDSCWIVMNNRQWILQTSAKNKSFRITPPFDANLVFTIKPYLYAADYHNLYISALPKQNEAILHFKKMLTLPDTASFGGLSVTDPYGNIILLGRGNIYVIRDREKIFTWSLMVHDLVEGMYIDKQNRLWVISRFNGLMIFSLRPRYPDGYLKKEFHFTKEFETASPRCMAVDQNELLWVGTRYHGLMGFEFKNNQLKMLHHFQTHNGLTDNFITSLACDKDNNIIIGAQTGLDRLIKTKEGYRVENVTKTNNIFSYINYVWTDADNNAFAWTNTGTVFRVEPAQQEITAAEPQLLIEEIKVNGKSTALFQSPLLLDYQQRNITFSVAAPAFIDEKQIKYSYLLSGSSNNEWSDTAAIADIPLLNLSPGKYTLHVKAFFPSTTYSSKETEFSFSILPPWWQTWWIRTGMGVAGIGILITGIRIYYRRKLEKQKIILEKQQALEKERTRIASDMHDDLGAGLTRIKFIAEDISGKTNDAALRPDMEKLKTSSIELVENMAEIIWAMNEKNNTLEDLLFYLRSYSVDYCNENNLACEFILPENIPQKTIGGQIRRNIFLVLKESLHNIVKHAGAKKVIIDLQANEFLFLTITDDGRGFQQTPHQHGNGLLNMQQRASTLKGKLWISNNAGTVVHLEVPL